jgi:hypothetical protein
MLPPPSARSVLAVLRSQLRWPRVCIQERTGKKTRKRIDLPAGCHVSRVEYVSPLSALHVHAGVGRRGASRFMSGAHSWTRLSVSIYLRATRGRRKTRPDPTSLITPEEILGRATRQGTDGGGDGWPC